LITFDITVDPGAFRPLDELVSASIASGHSKAGMEVVSLSVQADPDGAEAEAEAGSEATASDPRPTIGTRRARRDGLATAFDTDDDEEDSCLEEAAATATVVPSSAAVSASAREAVSSAGNSSASVSAETAAAARGTGMSVRRVVQPNTGAAKACTTCGVDFATPEAHREHFKSELHRFNLKRKTRGMEPLSPSAFESMPEKAREAFLTNYDS
jgi:hypothetical protein